MTENNLQQAWLPEGCHVLDNDWGTAPGCAFEAATWAHTAPFSSSRAWSTPSTPAFTSQW